MPIDKIIPRKLVSDKDERLLEEGDMLDALNVTISVDGANSEGVIKNVKGTRAATALTTADAIAEGEQHEVIGSVVDNQRGFIYFFVWCEDSSYHTIYQYNSSTDKYRVVFRSDYLNFNRDSFVKADVVNANFQQDDNLQTILYFTDNINPPRKINVDRAIAGEYNGLSDNDLDYCLNSIKAAPTREPKHIFSTNEDILVNNMKGNVFQFATQFIYKDGEESALSPYSKIASPEVNSVGGLQEIGFGKNFFQDNICEINTRFKSGSSSSYLADSVTIQDVKKVRLLGRRGNEGNFFIIDEYDPYSPITRNILGVDVEVYNPVTGVYKFYNEGAYSGIPTVDANKLYDNIPFKARSQSYSANRLFYGNYEEGRPNTDVRANIIVQYSEDKSAASQSTTSAGSAISEYTLDSRPSIDINFLAAGGFSSGTEVVPAGSRTRIRFNYYPAGDLIANGSDVYAYIVNAIDSNGDSLSIGFEPAEFEVENGDVVVDIIYQNEVDITVNELVDAFDDLISNESFAVQFSVTNNVLTGQVFDSSAEFYTNGMNVLLGTGSHINMTVSFSDTEQVSSTTLRLKPRISQYRFQSVITGDPNVPPDLSITSDEFSGGVTQDSLDYDVPLTYLEALEFSSSSFALDSSFKAGSLHDFGVVYYDKYNRSSNVNKIGSAYVKAFPERDADERGPAAIYISITSDPPSWAERFQIVYSGMSSFSDFTTYTTGGGYPARVQDGTSTPPLNTRSRLVYLSLNTLDDFQDEKGALRRYSFTEGDILRVISYDSATGSDAVSLVYPTASDGTLIEFNVLGVKTFTHGSSPLYDTEHLDHDLPIEFEGEFIVLEAPAVNTSVNGVDGNPLRYDGFDWFSITGTEYPDGEASTNNNYWGKRCVVEILTPAKTASDKVYYEIGESQAIGVRRTGTYPSLHGPPIVTRQGDVFFRPTAAKTPFRDPELGIAYPSDHNAYDWNVSYPHRWRYENIVMESPSISDFFESRDWSRGRAHSVFENSATVRRYNGLTFSDGYTSDVSKLSLSSFNPSLANFYDLDNRYGDLNYLGSDGESSMIGLQENKMSLIPLNANIIEYNSGSSNVALSADVVGKERYAAGDFGCGDNPESVLLVDGNVYFVDISRQAVLRYGGNGLEPISDIDMSSFFTDEISDMIAGANRFKVVSGYNPDDRMYFVTFTPSGSYNGNTIGFDVARRVWQSRYSFVPFNYAFIDNKTISCYNDIYEADGLLFHIHDSENRNAFYNSVTADPSTVKVASKIYPSNVKVFNAISYEGNLNAWSAPTIVSNLNKTGTALTFEGREGSFYSYITRDQTNSTKHIMGLPIVESFSYAPNSIQFDRNINRIPIPIGAVLYYVDTDGSYVPIGGAPNLSTVTGYIGNNRLRVSAPPLNAVNGKRIVAYLSSPVDGDPIRGHWAVITMTTLNQTPLELYCINTHFADSKLHHN